MDDPPLIAYLSSVALAAALALVSATGLVLRHAPRDPLTALLEADPDYSRAIQEIQRRYAPYNAAVMCYRVLISMGLIAALNRIWGLTPALIVAGGLILLCEAAAYRLVNSRRPGTVIFFSRLARVVYWASLPLSFPLGSVMSRPATISQEQVKPAPSPDDLSQPSGIAEPAPTFDEERTIQKEERQMIVRVLEFSETQAHDVMVPRTDMVCLDIGAPFEDYLAAVREYSVSRIPVYEDSVDHIVGILHVRDLFGHWGEGDVSLRELVRTPIYAVPESKKLQDLLKEMRAHRQHMAIVLDEYGGTAGLVTVEDILEEIVGEIQDEFDAEEADVLTQEDGSYLLDGRLHLDRFREIFGIELPGEEVNSLGGFLVDLHGRVPKTGAVIVHENLEFHILAAEPRRILQVSLTMLPEPEKSDEE